ncbi:Transcription factor [Penicillium riverlandense]|uniref:Transcription factor n=1 Tax=Penicillium riverlandense TaxID=1903569 RepID=UPI002547E419|nr:Transcription factor [Penicillium riverlandense]KAJ5812660.1 Transcription factor [Penicillium riverlandense]
MVGKSVFSGRNELQQETSRPSLHLLSQQWSVTMMMRRRKGVFLAITQNKKLSDGGRIDTTGGTKEILGRLHEIEVLLNAMFDQISTTTASNASSSHVPIETSPPTHSLASLQEPHLKVPVTSSSSFPVLAVRPNSPDLPPMTIPVKHKTSSSYLLSLLPVKSLIGEYPPDLFFRLESKNQLPHGLSFEKLQEKLQGPQSSIEISRDLASELVSNFFSSVHQNHPVLDPDEFQNIYTRFSDTGPDTSIESALCMVVLALGAVAASPADSHIFDTAPAGMVYMQHAMQTLLYQASWSFSFNLMLPQALVLASVYFAYIVRPLQSWRLIYSATTILQFKLSGIDSHYEGPKWRESLTRLFWSCFLIECDRLAELELPRSGLQQLTDEMSLPECTNLGMMQATCYLAEISIRRLLNRIHSSLYPCKKHVLTLSSASLMAPDDFSIDDISSMSAVCDELHSQLELWHSSIPETFRPNLSIGTNIPELDDRREILRTRYFAARHIIYRPFLLYIVTHRTSHIPRSIVAKAGICIESCRSYIYSAAQLLAKPSQYTWTFSLSSLGAVVVLTLASLNPVLQDLVPDIDNLQTLVLNSIRPWAFSSLAAVVIILEDMQKKQRLLSRA